MRILSQFRRFSGCLLLVTALATGIQAQTIDDCTFPFTFTPQPNLICMGEKRLLTLTESDDSANVPVPFAIPHLRVAAGGDGLTLSATRLPLPDPALNFDKFYITTEEVANTPPIDREPLQSQIFGPFLYSDDLSQPAVHVLFASDLEELFALQEMNPLKFLVIVEEEVGETILSPGVESFTGVRIASYDFGDAPGEYPVLAADNGARHRIIDGVSMTNVVIGDVLPDAEGDGQPSAQADADDLNPPESNDERGVFDEHADHLLVAGTLENFTIHSESSELVFLNAWIDFNQDRQWSSTEQIAMNVALAQGENLVPVDIPVDAVPGTTFGRFRVNSTGGLSPTDSADPDAIPPDGEVEDHPYMIVSAGLDFGDAPSGYPVMRVENGARHQIDGLTSMTQSGTPLPDSEDDGQRNAVATGDDLNPPESNDERGVAYDGEMLAGSTERITVYSSVNGAVLNAWIDFNGNRSWEHPQEQIAVDRVLAAGGNHLDVMVPADAVNGLTYARFRLGSAADVGLLPTTKSGTSPPVGEVEDHQVNIRGQLDYGDAPAPFATRLSDNGPRHRIVEGLGLTQLGTAEPDGELDSNPDDDALGDDQDQPNELDDEQGVFDANGDGLLVAGTSEGFVIYSMGSKAFMSAWIDFNRDGDWNDPGEQIADGLAMTPGLNSLTVDIPVDAVLGTTYGRFRMTDSAISLSPMDEPGSEVLPGEVEDHRYRIVTPPFRDYGDAGKSYATRLIDDGPYHTVDLESPMSLGLTVDIDEDGVPSPVANADDLASLGELVDDEDGVEFDFQHVAPGDTITATISIGPQAGLLSAWVDLDLDGVFENLLLNEPAAAGQTFTVPITFPMAGSEFGITYLRVRLSDIELSSAFGPGGEGEVEDHPIFVVGGRDYGDAPDSYHTTRDNNGASHLVAGNDFYIGDRFEMVDGDGFEGVSDSGGVDVDADGEPSIDADQDDRDFQDDEDGVSDGVSFPSFMPKPLEIDLGVDCSLLRFDTNTPGGVLSVWVDFNVDGDWDDPNERIVDHSLITRPPLILRLDTSDVEDPDVAPDPSGRFRTYMRIRYYLPSASSPGQVGSEGASDTVGEVEDHLVLMRPVIFRNGFESGPGLTDGECRL